MYRHTILSAIALCLFLSHAGVGRAKMVILVKDCGPFMTRIDKTDGTFECQLWGNAGGSTSGGSGGGGVGGDNSGGGGGGGGKPLTCGQCLQNQQAKIDACQTAAALGVNKCREGLRDNYATPLCSANPGTRINGQLVQKVEDVCVGEGVVDPDFPFKPSGPKTCFNPAIKSCIEEWVFGIPGESKGRNGEVGVDLGFFNVGGGGNVSTSWSEQTGLSKTCADVSAAVAMSCPSRYETMCEQVCE